MTTIVDKILELMDNQDVNGIDRILSTTPLTDEIFLTLVDLPAGDLIKTLRKHLSSSWAPSDLSDNTKQQPGVGK